MQIDLTANRAACRRLATVFAAAAESAPGACTSGSPEARAFASALNEDVISPSNAWFESLEIDESIGPAVGIPPDRLGDETPSGSGCVVAAAIAIALVVLRGAVALWGDVTGLLR